MYAMCLLESNSGTIAESLVDNSSRPGYELDNFNYIIRGCVCVRILHAKRIQVKTDCLRDPSHLKYAKYRQWQCGVRDMRQQPRKSISTL